MRATAFLAVFACAAPVSAQDLNALDTIFVDSCSRHEIQIAEMSRGRGANSSDIAAFVSWTEINTYVFAYISFYRYFANRDQALRYIVDECRENPTATIASILEQHRIDQSWRATLQQIEREQELEEQLASALSALLRARERIEELEAQ